MTLANSSAGLFWGIFPTGTPAEFNEIVRITVSTKRNDEMRGMTTSQFGVVVGLDFLVNPAKLLMNPPRSLAAAQKQRAKISMNASTNPRPLAGRTPGMSIRNISSGRNPLRPRRLDPSWVAIIAATVITNEKA